MERAVAPSGWLWAGLVTVIGAFCCLMFESLTAKLQEVFKHLTGRGRLSEQDVAEAARQLRLAFLEADVNLKVVKDFVGSIREQAVGQEVMASLTPGQQVIKIVRDELTILLGGTISDLDIGGPSPAVLMLCGLQGSGKTTTAAKLATHVRRQGAKPLLVATDVHRPAAIEQLKMVAGEVEVPVFDARPTDTPLAIAQAAVKHAESARLSPVIIDTAGRLHIDEAMMAELREQKAALHPSDILLVVDAMTGQDAVKAATEFDQALNLTGFILTKLDGDARGGAALSIRAVTGKPIKFAGIGEKLDAIEPFHPDRMASRIMGMGDVLTLIDRAESAMDAGRAEELERRLRGGRFDLNDFLEQLRQVSTMGPLDQFLEMVPGVAALQRRGSLQVDHDALKRMEAIIQSMTPAERTRPEMIGGSRRRRIARGSGTRVQDVNQLLAQFKQMKQLLGQMADQERRPGHRARLPFSI